MPLLLRKNFDVLLKRNITENESLDFSDLSKSILFQINDLDLLKKRINEILNIGEKWMFILRYIGNLSLSHFCEIVFLSQINANDSKDAQHLSTNMQLFWNFNYYRVFFLIFSFKFMKLLKIE